MKKILLNLIIYVFVVAHCYAGGVMFQAGGVESASGDYTDVIFHLNGDGTVVTTTYTLTSTETGPSTGTVGSLADANATAALIGSNGFQFPTTSDLITLTTSLSPALFQYAFRIYFPTTFPSAGGADVFDIRNASAVRYAKVSPFNDGDSNELLLAYREDGGTARNISTDNAALAADTEYIVIVECNESTPSIKLSIYNTSYSLLDSAEYTTSFTAPTANYDSVIMSSEGITSDVYIDNVMVSDLSNARNFLTDTISSVRLIDRNDTPNP